ncbi:hypothetical protein CCR75_009027 [Bremia lactucae]|uniref:Uncharacterized protein n=1 Tax=Bremia lactucae TaxID=4779 RepID=A0A976ICN0_BRELC|nr:hypothetical protein CCR75_009027 [Bremia lactucae]
MVERKVILLWAAFVVSVLKPLAAEPNSLHGDRNRPDKRPLESTDPLAFEERNLYSWYQKLLGKTPEVVEASVNIPKKGDLSKVTKVTEQIMNQEHHAPIDSTATGLNKLIVKKTPTRFDDVSAKVQKMLSIQNVKDTKSVKAVKNGLSAAVTYLTSTISNAKTFAADVSMVLLAQAKGASKEKTTANSVGLVEKYLSGPLKRMKLLSWGGETEGKMPPSANLVASVKKSKVTTELREPSKKTLESTNGGSSLLRGRKDPAELKSEPATGASTSTKPPLVDPKSSAKPPPVNLKSSPLSKVVKKPSSWFSTRMKIFYFVGFLAILLVFAAGFAN